jgi:hypothetical protein
MPTGVKTDALGRADAAKQDDKASAKPESKADNKPTGLKSLVTPTVEQAGPQRPSELQELMAQVRSEIKGDPEAAKEARKEAMWSRLLEAGLNVMGGQSSNFAQNLALASPAAKGFGEDVKGLRAEENSKRKQLAELGLKGYELNQAAKKLAAEEAYMKQHGRYYEQAGQAALINANRADGTAGLRDELASQNLALNRQKAADVALEKAGYGLLATSKKPEKIMQAAKLKETIYKEYGVIPGGVVPAASASGAFNYVPGKGLVPV